MVRFFAFLLRLFFHAFRSKSILLSEIVLVKKKNEILLRKVGKHRVHFSYYDKLLLVVLTGQLTSSTGSRWSSRKRCSPGNAY
jgi:hypothetical protein